MYKQLYKLGYVGYLALFILSIVFYKEREIFPDTALHLFHLLSEGYWFLGGSSRYGAALTQVYPLMGAKLGLSLNTIAMVHSACFIVNYTICYFLCGSVFKNYRLALALLLFNTLFVADSFFWPISELPMGIAWIMVFFSFVFAQGNMKPPVYKMCIMAIATLVLVSFFHPLMIFPYAFILAFLFFSPEKALVRRSTLIALIIFFVASVLIRQFLFVSTHDRESSSGLGRLVVLFPNYFDLYSNKTFLAHCLGKYALLATGILLVSVHYTRGKKWLKLLMFGAFTIGYLLLINIIYSGEQVPRFYIENLYLPVGIAVATCLIFDILPLIETRRTLLLTGLTLVLAIMALRIYSVSDSYVTRLNWERNFLAKNADKKLLISSRHVPKKLLQLTWCTPYEFWLLSTIETGRSASINISDSTSFVDWGVNETKSFLPPWGIYKYSDLPAQYFIFKDTVSIYTVIE